MVLSKEFFLFIREMLCCIRPEFINPKNAFSRGMGG